MQGITLLSSSNVKLSVMLLIFNPPEGDIAQVTEEQLLQYMAFSSANAEFQLTSLLPFSIQPGILDSA